MIPESITVIYNDHVPLAPRLGQDGIRITAGSVASVPVALPGEPGDILSIAVKGNFDVQFRICRLSEIGVRATNASTIVWAKKDLLFLVPSSDKLKKEQCAISVISPDGDSDVIINTYERGT